MKNSKTKLIVANWKMNPESVEEAKEIAAEIARKSRGFGSVKVIMCPPFLFLSDVAKAVSASKKIILGAQDVFIGTGAAHTGEVSAEMLKTVGVKYVIIGHSERRAVSDTDEIVREKLFGALKDGLKVILCVGEKERNEHGIQYPEIKRQFESALIKLPKKFVKNLVIAYEPIWAIGKSEKEAMQPEALHEMTIFIKRVVSDILGKSEIEKIAILYGGSVTKNNAKEIIEKGNVDGLLVGRESLKTEHFVELVKEIGK